MEDHRTARLACALTKISILFGRLKNLLTSFHRRRILVSTIVPGLQNVVCW